LASYSSRTHKVLPSFWRRAMTYIRNLFIWWTAGLKASSNHALFFLMKWIINLSNVSNCSNSHSPDKLHSISAAKYSTSTDAASCGTEQAWLQISKETVP
jgi:hypothetical protein